MKTEQALLFWDLLDNYVYTKSFGNETSANKVYTYFQELYLGSRRLISPFVLFLEILENFVNLSCCFAVCFAALVGASR